MDRRQFIRIIGGTSMVSATAPAYGFSRSKFSTEGILLEACQFQKTGGWLLDTQFYQQMGGNQLLAHGMGHPVEDAVTVLQGPSAGSYHVHVRTRDWCPGDWEAPGKFKISINGKKLSPHFGTEPGWAWQKGGTIELKQGANKIQLHDLTGFEGRIDAIYFSKEASPNLPNEAKDVINWKDEASGRSKLKVEEKDFDLVVVGGGMSGCGAALAAKKAGLKVALIQDRPLFGGNASQEVRVHTLGVKGKNETMIKLIDTKHWPNGHEDAIQDQAKREKNMASSGVDLFPNQMAIGLSKTANTINSVDVRHTKTGIITRFNAPVFVDATGDGWLGFWSGAEFRYGREAASEFNEAWDKHGDLWSPKVADNKVMGTSVLWNSHKGEKPSRFPSLPWAKPVAKNSAKIQGEWFWEYSNNDLNQIDDAEQIRDHMFRAIYGNFSNAKKHPKHALQELKFVAHIGGRRESRRIVGDHIYKMSDATSGKYFDDTVVEEKRELDTHFQRKEKGDSADYLSKALFHHVKKYYIPFRSFYSKDISNLMMAGRCFSCTHIGLTGPRVMNTCAQMGIATGYAASLCKKYKMNPREIGKSHIKELRSLIGYS